MATSLLVPPEVFGPVSEWDFRFLPKDAHGLVVHDQVKRLFDYKTFELLNGTFHPLANGRVRDTDIEAVFEKQSELRGLAIDMRAGDNPRTNVVSVFPESIKGTAVYDVLFYTDWLFKFTLRYMTRLIFLDQPFDTVGNNDMIVSLTPNQDGYYYAAPTRRRAGFTALKNEISQVRRVNRV